MKACIILFSFLVSASCLFNCKKKEPDYREKFLGAFHFRKIITTVHPQDSTTYFTYDTSYYTGTVTKFQSNEVTIPELGTHTINSSGEIDFGGNQHNASASGKFIGTDSITYYGWIGSNPPVSTQINAHR